MQAPFVRCFMRGHVPGTFCAFVHAVCVERAHYVLKPVNDDADVLQTQRISITFEMVFFLQQKIQ
jgi:hypothetical protein